VGKTRLRIVQLGLECIEQERPPKAEVTESLQPRNIELSLSLHAMAPVKIQARKSRLAIETQWV
jgi:hypothetical protein